MSFQLYVSHLSLLLVFSSTDPKYPSPEDHKDDNGGNGGGDHGHCDDNHKKHCDPCKGASKYISQAMVYIYFAIS